MGGFSDMDGLVAMRIWDVWAPLEWLAGQPAPRRAP